MSAPFPKHSAILFGAILALAAATRLIGLTSAPPALLPDEATNGYDAYCLLETGKDRWGVSFPMHLEAFGMGDYRPALYAYLTMPFVALLGAEHLDLATRLPSACWAILTIACFYLLVARTCDRRTALWAALLLTLSPWHVYVSRFGHESSLTPLFPILALLTLSLAGWPLDGHAKEPAVPVRLSWLGMATFGFVAGLALYTYASLKLFVPAMLVAGALVYASSFRELLRSRKNRFALLAGAIVFAVVIAPMVWMTITQWDKVNARAENQSLFHQGSAMAEVVRQCAVNWIAHFGPNWLFLKGSSSVFSSVPGVGQLNWIMLPLLPIGLAVMWIDRKRNRVYGVLLAWLLLHPLASAMTKDSPHMLRAACGLGSFQWVAAIGAGAMIAWGNRRRWARPLLSLCLMVCVAGNATWSLGRYYRVFGSNARLAQLFQTDLRDALLLIRDRWRDYDRIFISDHACPERYWMSDHPYIHILSALSVEPAEFHAWEKRIIYASPTAGFHNVKRMGPFTLSTAPAVLDEYFQDHRDRKVLFVARPGDIHGGRVLDTVRDRWGETRFEIIEVLP